MDEILQGLHPYLVNGIGAAIGLSCAAAVIVVAFAIVRWLLLPKEQSVDKKWPPDVSLIGIFKWAVVMLVAAVLGKKVWDIVGEPVAQKLKNLVDEKFKGSPAVEQLPPASSSSGADKSPAT